MDESLTIAEALRQLRAVYGSQTPNYTMFYRAVLDGRVPGVKISSGWRIPADFEAIRLGMRLPPVAELAA